MFLIFGSVHFWNTLFFLFQNLTKQVMTEVKILKSLKHVSTNFLVRLLKLLFGKYLYAYMYR